jgi:hypothetical protein
MGVPADIASIRELNGSGHTCGCYVCKVALTDYTCKSEVPGILTTRISTEVVRPITVAAQSEA